MRYSRCGRTHGRYICSRTAILAGPLTLRFPLLLVLCAGLVSIPQRRHFRYVENRETLADAIAGLPGGELLAIRYHDARGPDRMARKYRAMFIDGVVYPWHLAISSDWKVHYFTAAMAANAAHREEERRFLDDMPAVLGGRAMAALGAIGKTLGLDYAGVDFALSPDGSLLVFEANATMVISPPAADPMWNYRRASAVADVLAAAGSFVVAPRGCSLCRVGNCYVADGHDARSQFLVPGDCRRQSGQPKNRRRAERRPSRSPARRWRNPTTRHSAPPGRAATPTRRAPNFPVPAPTHPPRARSACPRTHKIPVWALGGGGGVGHQKTTLQARGAQQYPQHVSRHMDPIGG